MKIETGGKVFKALKWTLRLADRGSDVLGAVVSGPFTIIPYVKKGKAGAGVVFFKVFVGAVQIGQSFNLAGAKKIANDNAQAALAFGPRPVTVTK